jgi:hypothetical protein
MASTPSTKTDVLSVYQELHTQLTGIRTEVLDAVREQGQNLDTLDETVCGRRPPDGSSVFERLTATDTRIGGLEKQIEALELAEKERLAATKKTRQGASTIARIEAQKLDNRTKIWLAAIAAIVTIVTSSLALILKFWV